MSTLTLMIVLRVVHILCGVLWSGATMAAAIFPERANSTVSGAALLREGAKLGQRRRVLMAAGILTVGTGFALFGMLYGDDRGTPAHAVLVVAAIAAILSVVAHRVLGAPAARRLAVVGQALVAEDRGPDADEAREIARCYARGSLASRVAAALLTVTVLGMAVVRYV